MNRAMSERHDSPAARYIGVDIGRTIRAAIVTAEGEIVAQRRLASETRMPRIFLRQLIEVTTELCQSPEAAGGISAIGMGWPGLVNQQTQHIELAPHLVDLSTMDVYRELSAAVGVPLVFDNDANMAAYGEWTCGAARGGRHVFFVSFGTGIGSALILDGRLHRGAVGYAGEFGHCKVDPHGIECGCGGVGCLETVASGPNIVRRVREMFFTDPAYSLSSLAPDMAGVLTLQRVIEAAISGDRLARAVLREAGAAVGLAIANVINLLNVDVIVIGGPVMAVGDLLLRAIRREASRHSFALSFRRCRFVRSELGEMAGVVGAALLARDHLRSALVEVF